MALIPPGLILDPPQPDRHCYGLLTGLQSLTEPTDPHWRSGVQVPSWFCSDLDSTFAECPPVTGGPDLPAKSFDRGVDFCESDPFIVYSSLSCPPVGWTGEQFYQIVKDRYGANVERALENIFWTGTTSNGPVSPSLAFGNPSCGIVPVDLSPGVALSPVAALGVLESALADCWPGPGTIHMNFGAVPFFATADLLVRREDRLETFSCNKVIAGAGYPGTGPAGVAPVAGSTWIFATSEIVGWRGEAFFNPPELEEAFDKSVNDLTVRLETEWAFSFVCCLFAVNVALCSNPCE